MRAVELIVTFTIDPTPCDGVGAWSNTGRSRRYIAETVVATATASGVSVGFRGRIAANRRPVHSLFRSDDPRVRIERARAAAIASAAWRSI